MDNGNFNDMLKKAQEMINNNQVPDEIKEMASKFGANSGSSNANIVDNSSNSVNSSSNTSAKVSNSDSSTSSNDGSLNGFDFSNIDIATLMKFQGILSKLNTASDDDMSKLLFALKPYLRNEKKEKVDEYIKLARMGKMTELFDLLGRKG